MFRRQRGLDSAFTLVELMIVVAIIGILAHIALPSFSRYVKKARTAEAAGQLSKMYSGALAYWESDHANTLTTMLAKQFPGPTAPQEADCCTFANKKCPGSDTTYTNPIWVTLNFNMADPHLFRPVFTATGTMNSSSFTATTNGNLDCDTTYSTFRINAIIGSKGDVARSAGYYVVREIE